MNVIVLYLRILIKNQNQAEPFPYRDAERRFLDTYKQFKPQIPHELMVVDVAGDGTLNPPPNDSLFDEVATMHVIHSGTGSDCGAYQAVASKLNADLVVCCNTIVHFWRHGWLEPIVNAASQNGIGIYGPTASYQFNHHIRTPCIGFHPQVLYDYPHICDTRDKAVQFESGPENITLWARKRGYPCLMVTESQCYEEPDWRTPDNIFRSGDQSNCLVWDRHTELYAKASPESQKQLKKAADGYV